MCTTRDDRDRLNIRTMLSCIAACGLTSVAAAQYSSGGLQDPLADDTQMSATMNEVADGVTSEGGETGGVSVSEYMTVDIFVQDEQLANVLQMLSLQSQRNIVASQGVSATVTANLYNVTFYDALDAILHVNGYGYVEKGNFIYVYTLEELETILATEQKLTSKVIQLDYLNANDAAEFVAPMLSEKGVIKTNGDSGEFNLSETNPGGADEFALAATLVIYDYEEHVEEIVALLQELDTRPAQVLVEATILQTQLNEANAFGVDFSFLDGSAFTDFFGLGGPLDVATNLVTGDFSPGGDGRSTGVVSSPGGTAGPADLKVAVIHDDLGIFLRALDEVTDTEILSNPKILALNRQPARVLVGRKIGYLSTTSTETSTTQSVEFLDTGTQLAFRPFISNDGMVRLELRPSVSEGVVRSATDATGAAVTIPDELTQEITTNVIVPDGSTVVLGGLFKETTTLSRNQVPILGDIPLLGTAFRGHEDMTDRIEIIFMVKPTIINDENLLAQGKEALEFAEAVRTGTRQGLLPWSRDRQTSQLNVMAERLAASGDTDRALWALRRSLELNPVQPAAIRLRETLLKEESSWPSRSILEQIVDGELADAASVTPEGMNPATRIVETNPLNAIESTLTEVVAEESAVEATSEAPAEAGTPEGQTIPDWLAAMLYDTPDATSQDKSDETQLTDVPVNPDE